MPNFEAAAQEVVDEQQNATRRSLYGAMLSNPDEAARALDLSRNTGLPADVVLRKLPQVEQQHRLDKYDRLLQESPALAQWLADQKNASVAHDDVENLSAFERAVGSVAQFGRSVAAGAQGMPADLVYGGARAVFETAAPLLDPLTGTILPENPLRRAAGGFAELQRNAQGLSRRIQGDTSGLGFTEQAINQGARSLGGNIVTLPMGVAGGARAMLAPLVGSEFGRSYAQARDQGAAPFPALTFGASQSAIEYATEKIPVGRLLGDMKAGTPFAKMLLRQVVAEVPGEQVATVLQDLNEWAMLNQDKPFSAYLKERPSAAAQTLIATIVGVGGQTTTVKAVDAAMSRFNASEQRAQESKAGAQGVKALLDTAQASKLRKRDPQAFEQFVAQTTAHEVFIDAATLAQTLGQDLAAVVEQVPALREQFDEALATGGTVSLPVSELAAYVPDQLAQSLVPHLRTSPDGMTVAEGDALDRKELQTEIDGIVGQEAATQPADPLAVVRESIAGQLAQAGRFTPDVNSAYAEVLTQFFNATAQRSALDVGALYQQLAPRIVSQIGMAPGQLDQTPQEQGQPSPEGVPVPEAVDTTEAARRGAYDPQTRTIALLPQADLSTFIHESGHFFLEAQAELAMQDNTPAEFKADMQALLSWFGVSDLNTWRGMTLDQKRTYHEQFARGFEAFAFEGNAPSQELQGVFQKFRGWLLRVYRSLAALNVELSDEVRGVMGRMLATDEQIKTTEALRSYRPLFESAESAGMTAEEWTEYQASGAQATTDAVESLQRRSLRDMQWLANAKSRALKKLQRENETKRAGVKAEVTAEVQQMPEFAAQRWLKTGVLPDGTATVGAKLSGPALADMYGDSPASPRRYLSTDMVDAKEGLHPDVVGEMFGFDSGDALVRAIVAAGKEADAIEAMTDQHMLERFGDLADPRTIERAADEQIHNDARARFLEREVNALGKAVGNRPLVTRAAREYAEAAIARRKVRQIRPAQFSTAEGRAARAAEQAFKKGDIATAAARKREQLLQNQLARVAHKAVGEVGRAVEYLSRFDSNATRAAIGPEYADQIDALLERYDLRPGTTLRTIDRRQSLAEWVESQQAIGLEPAIDERLLADAALKSYKEMTLEDLRGLVDTVKNIEHLGRLKQRLLTVQDKRRFDELVGDVATSIAAHGGKVKPVALEGRTGVVPWLQGVMASHRKISSLVRQMDGGQDNGAFWRVLVRPMNEAGNREQVKIEQATMALAAIYAPVMKLKGGITGAKVFIPEIGASLSRGGRLAVALNWGNATNRQRLADGEGWTPEQVVAVLSTLSPVELQFVNQVWEYLDSYWPDIEAKQLRVNGVAEDKVQAVPFTIRAADGSMVAMRGGYYPILYDTDRSSRSESLEAAEVAKDMMRGAFTRATTRRGHTKARVEEVRRPVRKDLGVVTEHVTQVVHDLAWHEWLIDANRVLSAKPVDQAIRNFYGPEVLRTIKDDITGIATGDLVAQTGIDRALRTLRANVSRSTMGLSFRTALMQPFGLTQSIARIGAVPVLRGFARWGGDAARMENSLSWIREKSDFMRLRAKTFNRELSEISGRVSGQSQVAQLRDGVLFFMTTKMQLIADVPTWIGRYEQAIAQGQDEATAVALADQAVIDAQGGGTIKDLTEVQRKHPFLTMFYSFFSTTLNLTAQKTANTDFKNPRAVAGWLVDMVLLAVIPAIGTTVALSALSGDDDDPDELGKKLLQAQAGYLLGMVVLAREFSGLVSGYSYNGPPVARVVTDAGKAADQVAQGELDEPAVLSVVRLLGTAFGIPTVQAIRSYRGWEAWSEDDAPVTSVLFGPPAKE